MRVPFVSNWRSPDFNAENFFKLEMTASWMKSVRILYKFKPKHIRTREVVPLYLNRFFPARILIEPEYSKGQTDGFIYSCSSN